MIEFLPVLVKAFAIILCIFLGLMSFIWGLACVMDDDTSVLVRFFGGLLLMFGIICMFVALLLAEMEVV